MNSSNDSINDESTNIGDYIKLKQKNCQKRVQKLKKKIEKKQTELKSQNSLLEQLNLSKKLFDENIQLLKQLEESNYEKSKLKEECQKLNNELIKNNYFISQLEGIDLEMAELKEKYDLNLIELSKYRKYCEKLVNEKEELKNLISQFQLEKSQNQEKFNKELKDENFSLCLKIEELTSELDQINKEIKDIMRFVKLSNKLIRIDDENTCCKNKCINFNLSNGSCISNNGFVRINDGKVKYYLAKDKGSNNWIKLYAENSFSKGLNNYHSRSLFYFEVKLIKEPSIVYAKIGFDAAYLFCNSSSCLVNRQNFTWYKFSREMIDGHWVLGLIEDGSDDFRLIICPNNIRDAATLIPIIKQHVHEGSEIKTDAWRAYSTLGQNGYTHRVVNHSDPENRFISRDGVNTQRIEANWRPAKDWFRQRRLPGYRFPDALVEYQWRRECKKMNLDPFEQLICAIVANYNFK
ncbi:hypothetical protein ACQ4LE_004794 [Meloidogyne hapla]